MHKREHKMRLLGHVLFAYFLCNAHCWDLTEFVKRVKIVMENRAFKVETQCPVALPQHASEADVCRKYRDDTLLNENLYYRINDPSLAEMSYPRLNQSEAVVKTRVAFDKDEAHISFAMQLTITVAQSIAAHIIGTFGDEPLRTYEQHEFVYNKFIEAIQSLHRKEAAFPSQLPGFLETISNEAFRSDKVFAQRRLAGLCPFYIKIVTEKGHVGMSKSKFLLQLNKDFEWDAAVSRAFGEGTTLQNAISAGRIYVLYHELYKETLDIPNPTKGENRTQLDIPSTLTVFVIDNANEFRPVAIQLDFSLDSKVLTPGSGKLEWEKAKSFVEMEDIAMCQIDGHLFQTHLPMELMCNIYPKHINPTHPLYQVLYEHCVGTSTLGMLGIDNFILQPGNYVDRIVNFGRDGAVYLINKLHEHEHYDDLDFMMRLKKNGLNNELLHYYPYRDDGMELWKEIKQFAASFVDLYYKKDMDVQKDVELQNFANELSADGRMAPSAGKGQFKGFPASFRAVEEVKIFLTRLVFLPIQHAVCNYPLFPYGAFTPMSTLKLYSAENDDDLLSMLPGTSFITDQVVFGFLLAGLRMNTLFDYHDKMADDKARGLVKKTYVKFMSEVQRKLEGRNQKRFGDGNLTFQYFEPKWLTSSIHI